MVSRLAPLQSGMATFDLDRREDDDVYYAELERQILELTAEEDEDEDFLETRRRGSVTRAYNDDATKANSLACSKGSGDSNSWGKRNAGSPVPNCISSSWQKSSGTGVFIPSIVKSRTRHASDQSASHGRKRIYRQVDQTENSSKYLSMTTWRSKREMRLSMSS
ncbi:hypothetical protein BT93_D1875 [Corymbia citriodora subsp. variegata]|nr:hypothetical protein BT93_D1875 [Corymbia citriodora subsp. variegata]